MNIKERLVRQSEEDIIYIGEMVERTLNGKFGEVLRAYINGKITKQLRDEQVNPNDRMPMSSDRMLGRCEAYTNILYDLEMMAQEAEQLKVPILDEEEGLDE